MGGCSCAGDGIHLLTLIHMQAEPVPALLQQRLPPSICLHSRPFSRRRRSKPWRSPGEGAEPTPPEKLLHELGEG